MMDRLKTDAVFWKREDTAGRIALDRAAAKTIYSARDRWSETPCPE